MSTNTKPPMSTNTPTGRVAILRACSHAATRGLCNVPRGVVFARNDIRQMLEAHTVICKGVQWSSEDFRVLGEMMEEREKERWVEMGKGFGSGFGVHRGSPPLTGRIPGTGARGLRKLCLCSFTRSIGRFHFSCRRSLSVSPFHLSFFLHLPCSASFFLISISIYQKYVPPPQKNIYNNKIKLGTRNPPGFQCPSAPQRRRHGHLSVNGRTLLQTQHRFIQRLRSRHESCARSSPMLGICELPAHAAYTRAEPWNR